MEEKERYKLLEEDFAYAIVDNEEHKTYQYDYFDFSNICDLLNQQDKENQQLKQQLHDLPKKIVKDVEKNFTEYLPLKYKTGAGFYSRLNTILKKYGGKDE